MRQEKQNKQIKLIYDKIPVYLLAAYIVFTAFTFFPVTKALSESEIYIVPNTIGAVTDFAYFGRELVLLIFGVFLMLYFIGERVFPEKPLPSLLFSDKKLRYAMSALVVYILFAALSSILSEYSEISFFGLSTEFQGLAETLGLALLCLLSYNYFGNEKSLRILSYALFVLGGIIAAMTLFEFFVIPFAKLFTGIEDTRTGIALLFGNSANYGTICGMLFQILLSLTLPEKKMIVMIPKAVCIGVISFGIICSASSAALYASAAVGLAAAIWFVIKSRKALLPLIIIAGSLALFGLLGGAKFQSYIRANIENKGAYSAESCFKLKSVELEQDKLSLYGETAALVLSLSDDGLLSFSDSDGNALDCTQNEKNVTFSDKEYADVTVTHDKGLLVLDLGYKDTIAFQTTDGVIRYIGLNGYLDEELSVSAFPELSSYYTFGTGRGYIWLNTLPLLKDTLLKGFGAGAFAYYYPQNDIVGMLETHGTTALLTDKPHNLYLQIFTSYGLPALLAFLVFMFIVLKRGIRATKKSALGIGLLLAVVCGMILGIANDENPATGPLFWILTGTLLSMGKLEKEEIKSA